jgi:hypothetical protein
MRESVRGKEMPAKKFLSPHIDGIIMFVQGLLFTW